MLSPARALTVLALLVAVVAVPVAANHGSSARHVWYAYEPGAYIPDPDCLDCPITDEVRPIVQEHHLVFVAEEPCPEHFASACEQRGSLTFTEWPPVARPATLLREVETDGCAQPDPSKWCGGARIERTTLVADDGSVDLEGGGALWSAVLVSGRVSGFGLVGTVDGEQRVFV